MKPLVAKPVRLVGLGAQAPPAIGLVVGVVALEPHHLPLVLEGPHVGGDAVEEPAIVADDHRAAREGQEPAREGAGGPAAGGAAVRVQNPAPAPGRSFSGSPRVPASICPPRHGYG